MKLQNLNPNGLFIVKSFYTFLIDGGIRCQVSRAIWNSLYPQKVNIFNLLVWRDKILTLENLAFRRYNKLPATTCVLCHADCEYVDHCFRHCQFMQPIWSFFLPLFGLPKPHSQWRMCGAYGGSNLDLVNVFQEASLLKLLCRMFGLLGMIACLMLFLCLHILLSRRLHMY